LQKKTAMLKNSINKYYTTIARIKQAGGTKNESVLRRAFAELLQDYASKKELQLVEEVPYKTTRIRPDGTLRTIMQLDWGYWESKDTKDELDTEIEKKLSIGYPTSNILFENSETAVLIQNGKEVMRIEIVNEKQLDRIISELINCVPQEYQEFDKAIKQFKEDVPTIVKSLRNIIDSQYNTNQNYKNAVDLFLETCRHSINPEITMSNIREMIIQHILTADIFDKIFGDSQFHCENNIAFQLQTVIDTFFTRQTKFQLLSGISHYYDFIRSRASQIADHQEKQKFLKAVYENFYSAYNPQGADRLGIVYTPNEIVKFMIESTDFLLDKYFDKNLADENVEILDPATGTGTFICDIIEHIPPHKLEKKYKNEIHANEVAILPYYIANLNIEYTYQQKMNQYQPFDNLCFVDTLDNMGFGYAGKQTSLFGSLSIENLERIKKQNEKKISVIIGNPPYNANQQNENENNKNRIYKELDERIEKTYAYKSSSQKTKVYDMYTRFFRWASDRINGKGIVSFISNNSFLNAKGFDSFRKAIEKEFNCIYIIDLGGDMRSKTDKTKKTGNVFGITIGVCITFLIRNNGLKEKCEIYYHSVSNELTSKEKLEYLQDLIFSKIPFERIRPDKNSNWLNISDNDFNSLLPLAPKNNTNSIFNLFTHGVSTNRDEWVYDFNEKNLIDKINFFLNEYNSEVDRWIQFKKETGYQDIKAESNPIVDNFVHERNIIKWSSRLKRDKLRKEKKGELINIDGDVTHEGNLIKWSKMLKRDKFRKGKKGIFSKKDIRIAYYRPFTKKLLYYGYIPIDVRGQMPEIFPDEKSENLTICLNGSRTGLTLSLMFNKINDLNLTTTSPIFTFPLFKYDENRIKSENITNWGLQQFQNQYEKENITKEDIFYYIYAVLHNPNYRKKYEQELKREYPRIPFYSDFGKWCNWGKQLAEIHLNFETIRPYPLVENTYDTKAQAKKQIHELSIVSEPQVVYQKKIKTKLKADKELGIIEIDELTFLSGVPMSAWQYQLGSRSAIEWILDQYKEKEPNEPIIAEKFNRYKFSEHKNHVIDLIKRVCNVSVQTMQIVTEMQITENIK